MQWHCGAERTAPEEPKPEEVGGSTNCYISITIIPSTDRGRPQTQSHHLLLVSKKTKTPAWPHPTVRPFTFNILWFSSLFRLIRPSNCRNVGDPPGVYSIYVGFEPSTTETDEPTWMKRLKALKDQILGLNFKTSPGRMITDINLSRFSTFKVYRSKLGTKT